MATFVLVHGAHLGSWSWNLVIGSLNRRGHKAINIDLPIEENSFGAIDYARVISEQIDAAQSKEDIVVVGHSFAGLIIPLLADKYPIRKFIYIAPLIPFPGYSIAQRLNNGDSEMLLIKNPPDPVRDRAGAFKYWLHDCEPDIASWAASRFRPQNLDNIIAETTPIKKLPESNTAVIVCTKDRLMNPESIENLSKTLLKVDPIAIDSGHCPQLSRPQELALLLMQLGNPRNK